MFTYIFFTFKLLYTQILSYLTTMKFNLSYLVFLATLAVACDREVRFTNLE